jgi:ferritin-like metal-binding protein YciE
MNAAQQKVVQHLDEAHANERALVRVLQSQIAMTPRGSYRSALETHLDETRKHAATVGRRIEQLGQGSNPLMAAVGLAETVVGQALALAKTPFDLLRGSGGEEKVLKNAKDACATEALEIATYTAIEDLARSVGDEQTARMATSIRADEERMLQRVMREIPKLTEAVLRADVKGQGSYDVTTTGAADTIRQAGKATGNAARDTTAATARTTGQRLAIARYDSLTVEEIIARLTELSQIDLATINAYERKNQNRTMVLNRIGSLRGDEPWAGYDDLTAAEVQAALTGRDDERARQVRAYERAHKNRAGVLRAASVT